jgi:hypothetical protein
MACLAVAIGNILLRENLGRDGLANPVGSLHKTLADHFRLLAKAGWRGCLRWRSWGCRGLPLHLLVLPRRRPKPPREFGAGKRRIWHAMSVGSSAPLPPLADVAA